MIFDDIQNYSVMINHLCCFYYNADSDIGRFTNYTQARLGNDAVPVSTFGNISKEQCAIYCARTFNFTCKSFVYYREHVSHCYLYNVTMNDTGSGGIQIGLLYDKPGYKYFERKFSEYVSNTLHSQLYIFMPVIMLLSSL